MRAGLRLAIGDVGGGLALGQRARARAKQQRRRHTNTPAARRRSGRASFRISAFTGTVTRPGGATGGTPPADEPLPAPTTGAHRVDPAAAVASPASAARRRAAASRLRRRRGGSAAPADAAARSAAAASLGTIARFAAARRARSRAAPAGLRARAVESPALGARSGGPPLFVVAAAGAPRSAAGAALLFWRRPSAPRSPSGPQFDAYPAPEPAPPPAPPPPQRLACPGQPLPRPSFRLRRRPSRPASCRPRLRPWIDFVLRARWRCYCRRGSSETGRVRGRAVQSGNAPARRAGRGDLFNAEPDQEKIAAFFANPAGEGERIAASRR